MFLVYENGVKFVLILQPNHIRSLQHRLVWCCSLPNQSALKVLRKVFALFTLRFWATHATHYFSLIITDQTDRTYPWNNILKVTLQEKTMFSKQEVQALCFYLFFHI